MVPVDPQIIQHPTNMQQAFNPAGLQASMARGNNVYLGGLPYAPGAGRPRNPTLAFDNATAMALQNLQGVYAQKALQRQDQKQRQGK